MWKVDGVWKMLRKGVEAASRVIQSTAIELVGRCPKTVGDQKSKEAHDGTGSTENNRMEREGQS